MELTKTVAWVCEECEEASDKAGLVRIYECGECGDKSAERRCENCNKFMAKLTDDGCPECEEGECIETESVMCPFCDEPQADLREHVGDEHSDDVLDAWCAEHGA